MKRRVKKILTFMIAFAMLITTISWSGVKKAAAAVVPPAENLNEKSILTASGDTLVSTMSESYHAKKDDTTKELLYDDSGNLIYDGYIQGVNSSSDTDLYYKLVFTVADATNVAADTKLFNFQPYDSAWGGWDENIITMADAQYDEENDNYVAYLSVDAVKKSLSTSNTLKGINVGFCQSEPTITLSGLSMLSEPTPEDDVWIGTSPESVQEITGQQLLDAGIDSAKFVGSNPVNVYIKVTKCSPYSYLRISGGKSGSYSNKALKGLKSTKNAGSSADSAYVLHGRTGDGLGANGTGYYVFPATHITKASTAEEVSILMRAYTNDVEAHIVGVTFSKGASISVAEDGTITSGFSASSLTLESTAEDSSDTSTEEQLAAAEALRQTARKNLSGSITACTELLSTTKYQEASIEKLQTAIATAQAVYDKEDATKTAYKDAREALEKVRTAMLFKNDTTASTPKDFNVLNKKEVIADMGAGINLGNTFDGGLLNATETSWQGYKTTKAYIKALHDAGYNTVRVPVTWNGYINDDYSIDEAWLSRVQEVVDYCTDQDMYCIINIHHDGAANHDSRGNNPECWLNTAADDIDAVYAKYEGVWRTLANRFKDYDDHLIFESMNEVTDAHDGTTNEDTNVLNNLNQLFVNTVRATGSNNTQRWLAFTGRFATFNTGLTLPDDTNYNDNMRLMCAVHIYKDNSSVRWTYDQLKTWQSSLSSTVKNVNNLSTDIPVYIGEYGVRQQVQSGSATGYNNVERALNSEFVNAVCNFYGTCPVVWDQGDGDYTTTETNTGLFNYWNRPALKPVYKDIIDGMMRGSYVDANSDLSTLISTIYKSYGHSSTSDNSVSTNPEVTEITNITTENATLSMKAGEYSTVTATVTPEDTNDLLLWSTDNDAVATVFNGKIHAKKSGVTTIHAFSQSGSASKDITVIVGTNGTETATGISTTKAYYKIEEGETAAITTNLTPVESTDSISYVSSNTEVATVSSTGQITAVGAGSTYIIVSAASGVSTIVKVVVPKSDSHSMVDVALNIYMNGGQEAGTPVRITEDGQYTVTYDLAKNASASDVTLKNIVSIYIKDCNAANPTVEKAQIRYDAVSINDQALTITNTDFKSALKTNGQFDTNDPINGWDGSAVAEAVTQADHTVAFTGISKPTKISVTFTIKGLQFFEVSQKENEASSMEIAGDNKIQMATAGETKDVTIAMNPITTDSFVTFYSTDASVVAVSNTANAVDAEGNIKLTLNAVSDGNAVITGITENGLKVFFSVAVGSGTTAEPTDPTPDGLDGTVVEPEPETTVAPSATPETTKDPDTSNSPAASPSNAPEGTSAPATNEPAGTTEPTTKPTQTPSVTQTPAGGTGTSTTLAAQKITVNKTITKTVGSKAFNLGAKTSGDGKLTYKSSNTSVVTVSSSGSVKVKKAGIATITVKAAATSKYSAASASCKITVSPKSLKLKKVKNVKGKKVSVSWTKDKTVKGYKIMYSTSKKFDKNVKEITVSKNKTSYVIKKLAKKKTYYIRMCAYVKSGNELIYSPYSSVKKVKVRK